MKFPEFYSYLSNVLLVDKGLRQPNLRPRVREKGFSWRVISPDWQRQAGRQCWEGFMGHVGWGPRARTGSATSIVNRMVPRGQLVCSSHLDPTAQPPGSSL